MQASMENEENEETSKIPDERASAWKTGAKLARAKARREDICEMSCVTTRSRRTLSFFLLSRAEFCRLESLILCLPQLAPALKSFCGNMHLRRGEKKNEQAVP